MRDATTQACLRRMTRGEVRGRAPRPTEGDRAEGRAQARRRPRPHPQADGDAGEAVAPDRGRGRKAHARPCPRQPLPRRHRPPPRGGRAQHDDSHEQRPRQQSGRAPHGRRHAALRAGQAVRQGRRAHDEGGGLQGAEPETLSVETAPLAPRVDVQGKRESRRWHIGDIFPAAIGCLNATENGYLSPTLAWLD